MFLPKHPSKPSVTSSSSLGVDQRQGSVSSSSSTIVSHPKRRITPTLVDPSTATTTTTSGLTTQQPITSSEGYSHSNSSGSSSLFKNLNDDEESINSSSDDDDYDDYNDEDGQLTDGGEYEEYEEDNDEEMIHNINESIQLQQPPSSKRVKRSTSTSLSSGQKKPIITRIIEEYSENEIQQDTNFLTNYDISAIFSSLSSTKRTISSINSSSINNSNNSNNSNTYSFYYLKDDIVLYEMKNRLHFGKLNETEKFEKKLTNDIINKLNNSIDLNLYPQISRGDIKITQIKLKTTIEIITPIEINCYYSYNNIEYIIITKRF
ncbi:predicted protein [Naegleria gruberi]|uniref:Predicted protein n=1 Tax=Naegleria gruberi TaxID=5762 RepID=D2W2D8_NAEGR|nr:uncharacterized protein NAEGRDRAFT_54168 [Naegleria gruberi]EFC36810.1 predicted protein [Naegleria gruberi]|eukprot:XP_002669554.1 predicted protein [Naegleria gruberi strain NEG-M]